MLTCREIIEFLMEYDDGALPAEQRAEFERHLAVCPPCVNYLNTYRTTMEMSRSLCDPPDAPAEMHIPEELIQAILASRERR